MSAKKKTASKAAKKTTAKKATKKTANKAASKVAKKTAKVKEAPELDEKAKEMVLNARKRTATPALFKQRKTKNTPIMFTMEDVAEILEKRKAAKGDEDEKKAAEVTSKKKVKVEIEEEPAQEQRNHSAASLADILGFNPAEKKNHQDSNSVPSKWEKYYKALLELRSHVSEGLALHTADTLKRSNKEDSGDLSGYGQHMADAGTDTFDRDFALSLVSNEQEALYEIEEAIQRIYDDKYGVCEITNEPIAKERLMAVPFTRYSLEGQRELERNRRHKQQRGGVFGDNDEVMSLGDDDGDDS
ncbi:TraR/DksA family transcriptional regulator [Rubellicoccus peritrichatus]|uniref:TraR/DksA C4-type zinc finger protein n=1 Tax=Rubellicoccus peritrichatus TaxID=3080537 RepID=A0AAQ3QWL9_9BACT|nr:TraR/DksA C4-type zinc finger protein [Puniceicoccus sp. CR14]WOO42858.1 TraR/DksA C4-type zinc finger protein [Puniceicoccus sp. CR14]